jgi:hypothetical protein
MKDVQFIWHTGTSSDPKEPITISRNLEMPDFVLSSYEAVNCKQATSTG